VTYMEADRLDVEAQTHTSSEFDHAPDMFKTATHPITLKVCMNHLTRTDNQREMSSLSS